jgi:hypothetical protein
MTPVADIEIAVVSQTCPWLQHEHCAAASYVALNAYVGGAGCGSVPPQAPAATRIVRKVSCRMIVRSS